MTTAVQPDLIEFAIGLLTDANSDALAGAAFRGGAMEPDDDPRLNLVVVLEEAGWIRERGIGLYSPFRLGVTTFGVDERTASAGYRAVTDVFHRAGPVVRDGVGLYRAYDETGPSPVADPATRWSGRFGVVAMYCADEVLA
jgi:hypothetical protein